MEDTLDKTTLSTIALLEARLLRIEHLLYGPTSAPSRPADNSVATSLADLERRFSYLLSRIRVYGELLKIYRTHPSLFQAPKPEEPPTQLTPEALRSTVLSFASSFPSTASSLTAVTSDTPIPDPKLSSDLISLLPRMKGIEATQLAQEAEIAELRTRSEQVIRAWYENRVLGYSNFIADVEGRVEKVERAVRRTEGLRARAAEEV